MNKLMMKTALALVLAILATAGSAMADQITGDIRFTGLLVALDIDDEATMDLSAAYTLRFYGRIEAINAGEFSSGPTGDYNGLVYEYNNLGSDQLLTLGDVAFRNKETGEVKCGDIDINPLWAADGFSFALQYLSEDYIQEGNRIALKGWGTVTSTNTDPETGLLFDDTPGYWSFTTQNVDQSLQFPDGVYSWSATYTSPNERGDTVPEPGTMILLGTGLLGIATFARRRMRK